MSSFMYENNYELTPLIKVFMKRSVIGFICCILTLLSKPGITQTDSSCGLRISVLTCSPGQDLYSLFGHNALRIIDTFKTAGGYRLEDSIYNWGTFDFDEPNFYFKFMRGKLLYFLSPDRLEDFIYEYRYEGRSVTEQVLNLSCAEKLRIKQLVSINMTGNNRFYKYDFLFDNCTTRIRDIIEKNVPGIKVSGSLVPPGTTFRNMLYSYLDKGSQPWSKLGIDILLGSEIDKPVTNDQSMFLPEYLMKAVDSSSVNNISVVSNKHLLVNAQPYDEMQDLYNPLITIGFICIVLFMLGLLKTTSAKTIVKFTDTLLLYITGLIGLLILFMWFFTDHKACSNNYNIAWALPTNFAAAFVAWRKPSWVRQYFKIAAVVTALLLLSWFWLPQQMNIALLPFTIYMLYRYVKLVSV
ncbi:DUF4105 domain-containing protein [Panacibacter ginsenosidivorans]|uniref:DUF4105 domain-containing protein n=2 Tax=Panacibacter ginsenosidivorans TaxID=1813871 RepID=A0A5B8V6B5_9BACT|nr:DUF4105 domain-containing protein [Panacibacter ginsenosidivorans]